MSNRGAHQSTNYAPLFLAYCDQLVTVCDTDTDKQRHGGRRSARTLHFQPSTTVTTSRYLSFLLSESTLPSNPIFLSPLVT